ncbi:MULTISPECIES: glycosyltransferase 87 family protein [unclassified Kitasatospora]|uniref:glycosyltransferase 87 family protein n=1 Tax=unclassified Kitasatospora TaxID=2633591 RepID=UPI0024765C74|nr:glycosyltransferase 87 family protein [Kitasatospora sp. GAS204B]
MPAPRSPWLTLPALAAVAALTVALALTFTTGGTLGHRAPLTLWYPIDLALFAVAILALRLVPARLLPAVVLAGAVAVAASGLLAAPRTSDDAYRYLWDGQVQAAGHSPYDYPPDAPQLAGLRVQAPALFPPSGDCVGWDLRRAPGGFCSHVNRPGVPTIYPPVAEFWFLGLHLVEHGHGVRAAQAGGALLAVATTALLLFVLPPERRRQAALWGWFPGVAVWAVNDAHVDALGALLTVAGLALAVRGRAVAGGAALGGAAAVKLIPALVLPGAMAGLLSRRPSRRDALLPLAAAGVFALGYLPYLLLSGRKVLGFLPGYLHEEGYDQGSVNRYGLLRVLLPDSLAALGALLAILVAALAVLRWGDPARPWRGALLVSGTALLALTPDYPWYGLLVVALVGLDGRWEWLAVPAAGQLPYLYGGQAQLPAYGAALGLVLAGAVLRRYVGTALPPAGAVLRRYVRTARPPVGSRP